MTPQHPRNFERRIGQRHAVIDRIIWEPDLRRGILRRRPWEQATVVEVSATGALIRAHANRAIKQGTLVSIAVGPDRGLVTVRHIDAAPNPEMSYYGVQFVSLAPGLQTRFDDALSIATANDIERPWERTTEQRVHVDIISLQ